MLLPYLFCALLVFVPAAWSASGLTYSTYLRQLNLRRVLNPFMWQVDVVVPAAAGGGAVTVSMDMNYAHSSLPLGVVPVGPLAIAPLPPSSLTHATPVPIAVWVAPSGTATF
jgi:hypothetical protein